MKNFLIYRNNSLWTALKDDLVFGASYCGGNAGKCIPAKPEADVQVQIFPAGTHESEIELWVNEHREELADSNAVYADNTVMQVIIKAEVPLKRWQSRCIDDYFNKAATRAFEGKSPTEMYRRIFAELAKNAGIRCIHIVLDALTDYNPLAIVGFDSYDVRNDVTNLRFYAEKFKELIPSEVVVEFVQVKELGLPDANTAVIVHHHALNTRSDAATALHGCPRVLMPYPHGLLEKAGKLCDLEEIVRDNLLDGVRECVRMNIR